MKFSSFLRKKCFSFAVSTHWKRYCSLLTPVSLPNEEKIKMPLVIYVLKQSNFIGGEKKETDKTMFNSDVGVHLFVFMGNVICQVLF